jgi:hypothetical protein
MIYGGPGFLAVQPVSRLYFPVFLCRRSSLLTGGGGGRGAKSYDLEKAWSSINQSTLTRYIFEVNVCELVLQVNTYTPDIAVKASKSISTVVRTTYF